MNKTSRVLRRDMRNNILPRKMRVSRKRIADKRKWVSTYNWGKKISKSSMRLKSHKRSMTDIVKGRVMKSIAVN